MEHLISELFTGKSTWKRITFSEEQSRSGTGVLCLDSNLLFEPPPGRSLFTVTSLKIW